MDINDLLLILTFIGVFAGGFVAGVLRGTEIERKSKKPLVEPKKPLPECLKWVNEE